MSFKYQISGKLDLMYTTVDIDYYVNGVYHLIEFSIENEYSPDFDKYSPDFDKSYDEKDVTVYFTTEHPIGHYGGLSSTIPISDYTIDKVDYHV